MMKVSDFDFNLPKDRIAQHPSEKRDHSRLMILNRNDESIEHQHFYDITKYLGHHDVLVINNTKVIPARLMGVKAETDALIEVLLLKELEKDLWEAMTKPAKRVKIGTKVLFGDLLIAECIEIKDEGLRVFKMHYSGLFIEILEQLGTMPLPPYITEKLEEKDRYQTVYAKDLGSAAAPTAGLHFTKALLKQLESQGVEIIPITLHVGLGTFKPVSVDNVLDHHMHEETYTLTKESTDRLNQAVKNKKNIVCVGTTSLRTIESNFDNGFHEGTYETGIFIYPGYQFKAANQLITNFHLPKSTLMMLVSAIAGTDFIKKAYQEAIDQHYRFFSFGDAMFIK
ncbi:tRNA preQ1(34) S-adenosylmethionine ribosyltransferase-isomerase QueA [Mariniplasma sp. M4Ah]|uniref:S-adenosylmethionine:tRNA ribosyltransferase-isomerase n=2 Tax=Peloplasma aerotolerans TaxID=3044389 RepID=A0AAW6U8W2_9MOLU|nr:tRNA preQ1(34) S-adenosylmethionine ribosyltransferase-isomerase QueA [Mariniplasma sp. M4Ah]MDI6451966.1 tRNA preQ1(34) S-adenosylmethionine ribosyltransferase-isomerase QueA [Mariniplasma sp. M4Ah]